MSMRYRPWVVGIDAYQRRCLIEARRPDGSLVLIGRSNGFAGHIVHLHNLWLKGGDTGVQADDQRQAGDCVDTKERDALRDGGDGGSLLLDEGVPTSTGDGDE